MRMLINEEEGLFEINKQISLVVFKKLYKIVFPDSHAFR